MTMDSIEAWDVGTPVKVGGNIPAEITAVIIRGAEQDRHVLYEVAWWSGRDRHSEFMPSNEFHVVDIGSVARVDFRKANGS